MLFNEPPTLSIANSLHLPAPSDEQLAEYIRTLRAFAGPDGQYDNGAYARFLDRVKRQSPVLSESIISAFLKDDYRANQVNELVGGPGYVLDAEIKSSTGTPEGRMVDRRGDPGLLEL